MTGLFRSRLLRPLAVLALTALLGGCYAYPGYGYYNGGPYYGGGVVAYGGGWHHGWYHHDWR